MIKEPFSFLLLSDTHLDRDDSFAADLLHGVGNDGADLHVSVG